MLRFKGGLQYNVIVMYNLKRVEVDTDHINKYQKLLQLSFPDSNYLNKDYLQWLYTENPEGNALGFNAFDKNTLAGHYVCLPISANIFGKTEQGLLSLNTATHPSHRGKGLFTQLAQKTYQLATKEGYTFIIGVANQNSTPGFLAKLNFQLVAPLKAALGFGNPKINQTQKIVDFSRTWNESTLRWRLNNPIRSYQTNAKGNTIYANTEKFGIHAILVKSINPNLPKIKSLNPTKLWIGLDSNINWKKSLYLPIPQRLRPSPLNLIFKDLTNTSRKLVAERVRFNLIDFDAY